MSALSEEAGITKLQAFDLPTIISSADGDTPIMIGPMIPNTELTRAIHKSTFTAGMPRYLLRKVLMVGRMNRKRARFTKARNEMR